MILSADQNVITETLSVCEITGYISPQEQFRLTLPVNNYSGIYMQKGCGSFCGLQIDAPPNAGGKDASTNDNGASPPATTATTSSETSNPANPANPRCGEQTADLAAARSTEVGAHDTTTTDTQPQVADGVPATGTDNEGHRGAENDALWAKDDPALRVSFGYSSEHALAQAAKAIIAAYYGSPPRYTFYDGCSGGGREALVEAQRYPKDFNGILAGRRATSKHSYSASWRHG